MIIKTKNDLYETDCLWSKKGDVKNIKVVKHVYCCSGMKSAMDEHYVVFGEYESSGLNKNKNVNIIQCSPYPEGAVFNELPIKFCPFCSASIKIKVV